MLFDPKWNETKKEIQTQPSLADFIVWLESKDPEQGYNFNSCRCLLGQYMAACGIAWGAKRGLMSLDHPYIKIGRALFGQGRLFSVASDRPWTFGAALDRARAWAATHRAL